ncbi:MULTISPECIES: hypothetical protein [unclassified Thiocapsa]|uniref:hypothetical protein n=1 Tax=unclassified Thiocapsa TaxID=2641286 RepID=UPI0035B24692
MLIFNSSYIDAMFCNQQAVGSNPSASSNKNNGVGSYSAGQAGASERLATHPLFRKVDLDVGGTGHLNQSRVWIGADVAQGMGITGRGTIVAAPEAGIVVVEVTNASNEMCLSHPLRGVTHAPWRSAPRANMAEMTNEAVGSAKPAIVKSPSTAPASARKERKVVAHGQGSACAIAIDAQWRRVDRTGTIAYLCWTAAVRTLGFYGSRFDVRPAAVADPLVCCWRMIKNVLIRSIIAYSQ